MPFTAFQPTTAVPINPTAPTTGVGPTPGFKPYNANAPVVSAAPVTAPIIGDNETGIPNLKNTSFDMIKNVFKAIFSSVKGVGETIGQSAAVNSKDFSEAQTSTQGLQDQIFRTHKLIQQDKAEGKDTSALEAMVADAQKQVGNADASVIVPASQKTNAQALADVGGVALDMLTAGTYGTAGKAAKATEAAVEAGKATAVTDQTIKDSVQAAIDARKAAIPTVVNPSGIKQILKQTAARSAVGGGVGYASDVDTNLKNGKTGVAALTPGAGTAVGIALPAAIGGIRSAVAISKDQAPRFINSLIKPKTANFAYGKDPGRTVSELGITGNSLPDFERNISTAKDVVGSHLGNIYTNPTNAGLRIDASDDINKIDSAIAEAAKGGKNNQGIVTQLVNIKDGLLYEHNITSEGDIARVGNTPRDLSSLSPAEAQDLIQHVSAQTKFTGSPSDDKTVNSILKDIYSGIRDKINTAVSPNNPEVEKLNMQYGDLVSAELATRNREAIIARSGMINLNTRIAAGTAGTIAAVLSHGITTIPTILATVGAGSFEKAMETTAVKTRIAAWLGSQTPSMIRTITAKNPQIVPILLKVAPNLAGKI